MGRHRRPLGCAGKRGGITFSAGAGLFASCRWRHFRNSRFHVATVLTLAFSLCLRATRQHNDMCDGYGENALAGLGLLARWRSGVAASVNEPSWRRASLRHLCLAASVRAA